MFKIWNLYRNEMFKLAKKPSTWILTIIIPALVIFVTVISLLVSVANNYANMPTVENDWKASLNEEINMLKGQYYDSEGKLIEGGEVSPESQLIIDKYLYQIEKNIKPETWKAYVLDKITQKKISIVSDTLGLLTDAQKEALNKEIENLWKTVEQDNWKEYLNIENEQTKNSQLLSEGEKNVILTINKLRIDYDIEPKGSMNFNPFSSAYYYGNDADRDKNSWKHDKLRSVESNMTAQVQYEKLGYYQVPSEGMMYSSGEISYDETLLKKNIAIDIESIKTNNPPLEDKSFIKFFGDGTQYMFLILIFVIIVAGTVVSQEFTRGTVKFLVVTPNKRWKIFTAKIMAVVSFTVFFTLTLMVSVFITSAVSSGMNDISKSKIFFDGSKTYEVSLFLLCIRNYGIELVSVLAYAIMAVMLATLSRSTALSVAFGIGLYFVSSIVVSLSLMVMSGLSMMYGTVQAYAGFFRYILFYNTNALSYAEPLYQNDMVVSMTGGMVPKFSDMSAGFSLCVLAAYIVVMLMISYDSFNRRDIKN